MSSASAQQDTQDGQEVKKSNWKGFGKSIVSAFVITFIWAIIGCNFMFLQRYVADGGEYLGTLFPDNPNQPPYESGSGAPRILRDLKVSAQKSLVSLKAKRDAMKAKMASMKRSNAKAGADATPSQGQSSASAPAPAPAMKQRKVTEKTPLLSAVDYEGDAGERNIQSGGSGNGVDPKRVGMFKKMTNMESYSFPYNWKSGEEGLVGDFKAWIAESVEFSYVNGRKLMNAMFDGGDMMSESMTPILVLLLSVPLVSLLLSAAPFYGFLSTLVGEFQAPNKGWLWALVFLFVLGFDFILASAVGFWQTIQVFFTFLLLPLLVNASNVFSIMGEHYAFFTAMFGLIVVSNAFAFLRIESSLVMFLTYLYLVWKTWKN